MSQNNKECFKRVVGALVLVLLVFAAFLFLKAVTYRGRGEIPAGRDVQIHVFINQNDSVVNALQKDVEHLSSLLEVMQSDTVIMEIRRFNGVEPADD